MKGHDECVDGLINLLEIPAVWDELQMIATKDGVYLAMPSTKFKDDAEFDTTHKRRLEFAPSHGYIAIAHMFIEMPELNI